MKVGSVVFIEYLKLVVVMKVKVINMVGFRMFLEEFFMKLSIYPCRQSTLGPVVRMPIRLNFNPGVFFFSSNAFSRTIFSVFFLSTQLSNC